MALKDYATMHSTDWVQLGGKYIDTYLKRRAESKKLKSDSDDEKDKKCNNGIVQVGGYTNAHGNKVAPYERICPYHYQGKRPEKHENEKQTEHKPGFELIKNFSSDTSVNSTDVINLKTNLSKMNYYRADARSEKNDVFHGYPNDGLISAIKQFQQDNGIKPTGHIFRGDATEAAINSKFESHGVRFNYPVNTDETQVAVFDGKSFTLYQDNKPIISWDAVSGKSGYQSPEYQNLKSTGPIPEGTYVARQKDLQFMNAKNALVGVSRVFGDKYGGRWPGSYYSWGNSRVWLEPDKNTNTYERNNFSIHGGMWPGSAGCIDMTGQISAFTNWFKSSGKDLVVKVKY